MKSLLPEETSEWELHDVCDSSHRGTPTIYPEPHSEKKWFSWIKAFHNALIHKGLKEGHLGEAKSKQ